MVSVNDIYPTILAAAGVPLPDAPSDGTGISGYLRGTAGFHRPQELMIHFPHDHNGDW
jgi:arylsulfatase A-like enzyme